MRNEASMDSTAEIIASFFTGLTKRGVPEEYASILTRIVLERLMDAGLEFLVRQSRGPHGDQSGQ